VSSVPAAPPLPADLCWIAPRDRKSEHRRRCRLPIAAWASKRASTPPCCSRSNA